MHDAIVKELLDLKIGIPLIRAGYELCRNTKKPIVMVLKLPKRVIM